MTANTPTVLHRSFEHEVLLQPCGFTNIAVVHVPEKSGVRVTSRNESYKRRWLFFVDRRRGLLGHKVLACPARAEPPPGRRRSDQFYTRSTPTGSTASVPETNSELPAKPADLPRSQNAHFRERYGTTRTKAQREPPSDLDCEALKDEDRRWDRRRSLPLLTERFSGSAGDVIGYTLSLGEEGNHDSGGERGQDSPTAEGSAPISSRQRADVDGSSDERLQGALLEGDPPRVFTEGVSSPLTKDEHLTKTRSDVSVNGAPAAAASPSVLLEAPALSNGTGEDNQVEEGEVKILLRGLNRPLLVAAAAGSSRSMGVFFVDHAPTSETYRATTNTPPTTAAGLQSQVRALHKAKRGESFTKPRASRSTNLADPGRTGRLRFLQWGAKQPVTLVEDLRNPVALCVNSSDSSVFVLEEVMERQYRYDEDDRDRDHVQDRRKPQPHHRRSKPRYQVCRLDGARLSSWLSKKTTISSVVSGSDFAKHHKANGQSGSGRIKLRAEGECGPEGFSADNTNLLNDESETEWETSSDSDEHDIGNRGNQGFSCSSTGARVAETGPGYVSRSGRRRGVVSFVRVLQLPSTSARTNDNEGHPEQPVDMCVLTNGTIVVAFSRSDPLHGGASIAESQGIIRAFPVAGGARSTRPAGVSTSSSSTNKAGQAFALTPTSAEAASRPTEEYVGYDADDSWLVAEGLPVVTGLAAAAGDAVYLSLCGAGHDGAVTAVGALSTRLCQSSLKIDDDIRGRTKSWEGRRGSIAGGESMLARGGNGGGGTHRCGGNFVRIASGYAAALAVDGDMNLFYVTAESTGSCRALWCSVPGEGSRRVVSLSQNSPSVNATAAGTLSGKTTTATAGSVAALGLTATVATRDISDGEPVERRAQFGDEREGNTREDRHARTTKALVEATKAAAKRAVALSAALLEDDDQATSASRTARKPLFASRTDSMGGLRAEEIKEGFSDENESVDDGRRDVEEAVNIAVVSRCRPLLAREMKRGVRAAVFCDGNEVVVSGEMLPNKRPRRFGFDRVFGPGTGQARVYAEAVYPVVRKMLDGFNCSVLAYGQTGSGKTFTMEGGLVDPSSAGRRKTTVASATADPEESDGDATAALEIEKIGVIPRAVHTIFREGGSGGTRRYWVYVSHMEIYNERLFDLLVPSQPAAVSTPPHSPSRRARGSPSHRSPRIATGDGCRSPRRGGRSPRDEGVKSAARKVSPRNGQRRLSPRHAGGSGGVGAGLAIEEDRHLGVVVKGLTQVEVKSPEDIFAIIARSKSNRRTAETMCNVESSRSHGVFSVRVISAEPTPWGGEVTRDGRLNLVDLSGSENIKRSGAAGTRAKEAAAIGQSLLSLGRVIKALVQHAPHIPYRESKLTRVLGDSLGGNAFTAIILNITPNSGMLDETLNTLTYAKTAQSVQNTPKRHIANKDPTDEATTGDGAAHHPTSSVDPSNISCNIANELKRWRDGARSRMLSSASSRSAHIRPWEGKIPIHAPSQASPRAFSRTLNIQDGGNALLPLPQRQSTEKAPHRGGDRRRRQGTVGATHTRAVAQTAGGLAGNKKAVGMTPRRGRGGYAAVAAAALARAGLLSSASENNLCLSTRPQDGRLDEHIATWRVFDSTTANWVHAVVLKNHPRQTPPAATGGRCDVAGAISAAASAHSPAAAAAAAAATGQSEDVNDASLTPAAKRAIEEVFDRYNRSCKASRVFLLPSEIAALQEIWTRPDAELPPPRLLTKPNCTPQKSPPALIPTNPHRARPASGNALPEVLEARGSDGSFDKRVLTRPAFVEFCRRAAVRDAIFIRHFFERSGYDDRLELTVLPSATKTLEMTPVVSSVRQKKGPVVSEPGKSGNSNRNTVGRIDHTVKLTGSGGGRGSRGQPRPRRDGSVGGGGCRKGVVPTVSPPPASSQERGIFEYRGNDDVRCLASGGLVDPTELWSWTEDERDHGERQNLDGLLSRGGGAHVSRTAAAAIVDAFASTKATPRSSATTATTPGQENDTEAQGTKAGRGPGMGSLPEANTARDEEDVTPSAARRSDDGAGNSLCGAAAPPGGAVADVVGGSKVASRGPSTECEWCGAVVVAGGKASHSAAFCDEEFVRVPRATKHGRNDVSRRRT